MTSKKQLGEQVGRIYAKYVDRENIKPVLDPREAMLIVEQAINSLLVPSIREEFRIGNIEVPETIVHRYETNTVNTDSVGAYIDLPSSPLDLPMDTGIVAIMPENDETYYIPIPSRMRTQLSSSVSALEQQVGWYRSGLKVRFTQDITSSAYGSVSNVWADIAGVDFSNYTNTEMLPLSPHYEILVIAESLKLLGMGQVAVRDELNIPDN